jgi:hypothetical protein
MTELSAEERLILQDIARLGATRRNRVQVLHLLRLGLIARITFAGCDETQGELSDDGLTALSAEGRRHAVL